MPPKTVKGVIRNAIMGDGRKDIQKGIAKISGSSKKKKN